MLVVHCFSWGCPTAVQNMFRIQNPLAHSFDLLNRLCPGISLGHEQLETGQFLAAHGTHDGPFFSRTCRELSTASKASAAAPAGYSKGKRPSKCKAVCIPNA